MKKVILILGVLTMGLASCKKEEVQPNNTTQPSCQSNCGTITNDGIEDNCYYLDIQNSCTGNVKRFCIDSGIWANAFVGDSFCITNETGW